MESPLQNSLSGCSATTSAAAATRLDLPPSNATLPATVPVALRYQDSMAQTLDIVSAENVDYVWDTLHMNYPRPGKPKEELIFEVNYYVPEQVGSSKDRAEFVAKAVVELQKMVPMEGMPAPGFPERVEEGYLDRVREVLPSKGKSWVESMLQPASTLSSGIASTTSVPLAGPVQQMAERIVHPPLYAPVGYNTVVRMPEAGLNEMTMTRPVSTTSVSDRPSGLLPDSLRAYGTMFDTDGRFVVVDFGQQVLRNKFLCFWLAACFIVVFLWALFS